MLIGYARVSTIDQNPALQMDALKTAGCDKVFTEKASGSHRDRPQLKAALNYLREGDTLVVWKLSRLARSLTQVIKTATDINDRGIALKVLTQNIDTSTSEGRLFFHMTAAFDEFQRELIVENTRAGLAAANKRGRRGGRPRAMNEQTIKHAEAMLKDTENYPFIGDVIDQLKIGRTAFYRYFPTDHFRNKTAQRPASNCGWPDDQLIGNARVSTIDPDHPVQAFDGVGGVDDLAPAGGKAKTGRLQ